MWYRRLLLTTVVDGSLEWVACGPLEWVTWSSFVDDDDGADGADDGDADEDDDDEDDNERAFRPTSASVSFTSRVGFPRYMLGLHASLP